MMPDVGIYRAYLRPGNIRTRFVKSIRPEFIQTQLLPQLTPQPAIAKGARPTQLHLGELYLDRIQIPFGDFTLVGKKDWLRVLPTS